jgi:hypothetical protein
MAVFPAQSLVSSYDVCGAPTLHLDVYLRAFPFPLPTVLLPKAAFLSSVIMERRTEPFLGPSSKQLGLIQR